MKANLESWVKTNFNNYKAFLLKNYASCSEWLADYVSDDDGVVYAFFECEEIERNSVEELREIALAWIAENADEIIDFDDYRD